MQRTIKFRAWTGSELLGWEDHQDTIAGLLRPANKQENWKLMQFTELLDKNGKEIYEGDIMQYPSSGKIKGDVQWVDGAFRVNRIIKFEGYSEWLNKTYLNKYHKTHVVIGNIYENPDLIKD